MRTLGSCNFIESTYPFYKAIRCSSLFLVFSSRNTRKAREIPTRILRRQHTAPTFRSDPPLIAVCPSFSHVIWCGDDCCQLEKGEKKERKRGNTCKASLKQINFGSFVALEVLCFSRRLYGSSGMVLPAGQFCNLLFDDFLQF